MLVVISFYFRFVFWYRGNWFHYVYVYINMMLSKCGDFLHINTTI